MDGWGQDFRYSVRRLVRSPGFSLAALTILSLGIGVNSTAFSVVNALLFQTPPFEEPERLVEILQDSDGGGPSSTSYPAYLDVRDHEDLFEGVAALGGGFATLDLDGSLYPLNLAYATSEYLPLLGLRPSRGRWFDETEDRLGGRRPGAVQRWSHGRRPMALVRGHEHNRWAVAVADPTAGPSLPGRCPARPWRGPSDGSGGHGPARHPASRGLSGHQPQPGAACAADDGHRGRDTGLCNAGGCAGHDDRQPGPSGRVIQSGEPAPGPWHVEKPRDRYPTHIRRNQGPADPRALR